MDTERIVEFIIQAIGTAGAVGALIALLKYKAENDKLRAEAHRIRSEAERIDQEAGKIHQEAIQMEIDRLTRMAEFYFQKWQDCHSQLASSRPATDQKEGE